MNSSRVEPFLNQIEGRKVFDRVGVTRVTPSMAKESDIEMFHSREHIRLVKELSSKGIGYLDGGDTPAFPGVFEASSYVVGGTLSLLEKVATGKLDHGFNPVGGLHHARRTSSAGFCVFNDIGVAIELAIRRYDLTPVLYVDIDAHHGDGVFYSFEKNAEVYIADIHEDGHFLYPGTGFEEETGIGVAKGTKINVPLKPGAVDEDFFRKFEKVLALAERARPKLVILQAGADCLAGDPLTHLSLTQGCHRHATRELVKISHQYAKGRMIAMGGGGYDATNVARAWMEVVDELIH